MYIMVLSWGVFFGHLATAGSRSTSPSSRGSYLTHTGGASRDPMTPKGKRRSGIPRSQGTSREASPNRVAYGKTLNRDES